jgi:hypothetical protein
VGCGWRSGNARVFFWRKFRWSLVRLRLGARIGFAAAALSARALWGPNQFDVTDAKGKRLGLDGRETLTNRFVEFL